MLSSASAAPVAYYMPAAIMGSQHHENDASIAAVAMRARCLDALRDFDYNNCSKLRAERETGTRARDGHDWTEDNMNRNNNDRMNRGGAIFELLDAVPAISGLDSVFRRKLLQHLELVTPAEGEVVFHQGDNEETVLLQLVRKNTKIHYSP